MTISETVYLLSYLIPAGLFLGFAIGSMFSWVSFG